MTSSGGAPACFGAECEVDTLRVIKVVSGAGVVAWYEYVRPPCVDLAFFADAKEVRRDSGDWLMCADPATTVAASTCCKPGDKNPKAYVHCEYAEERVSFARAAERCAARGYALCEGDVSAAGTQGNLRAKTSPAGAGGEGKACKLESIYAWQNKSCTQQIQVNDLGLVNMLHDPS